MKKVGLIILGVFLVIAIGCYSFFKSSYNGMVEMQESVSASWSNVENQYQRRSDLIPNLVNSVKGYASHESETLEAVTQARANATKTSINVENMSEESLKQFSNAQGELSSALSRLMVVSEQYPDLKANQNFLDLQAQLEGTENRISTERTRFNAAVKSYNSLVRTFPKNIIASMCGFEPKPYFESEKGAEKAPVVEF
ncbi:MAG: LemA family protein [Rikenellaceae bacterium]